MSIVSVSMHCIRHKVQFTTHKNSSQRRCNTEGNKIWSPHFLFSWRPRALIICQSDRCFSNDGVSCVLNFYRSCTVRDCQTLYTIWWWKPPRTDSLRREAFCREVSTPEEEVVRVVREQLTEQRRARRTPDLANGSTHCTAWKSTVRLAYRNWIRRVLWRRILFTAAGININIDRKQICKELRERSVPQTEQRERSFCYVHFLNCVWEGNTQGGIMERVSFSSNHKGSTRGRHMDFIAGIS